MRNKLLRYVSNSITLSLVLIVGISSCKKAKENEQKEKARQPLINLESNPEEVIVVTKPEEHTQTTDSAEDIRAERARLEEIWRRTNEEKPDKSAKTKVLPEGTAGEAINFGEDLRGLAQSMVKEAGDKTRKDPGEPAVNAILNILGGARVPAKKGAKPLEQPSN